MKSKGDGGLNPEFLQQYAIVDKEADFEKALQKGSGKLSAGALVSIKSERKKIDKQIDSEKKRNKHDRSSSKSNKKRKT